MHLKFTAALGTIYPVAALFARQAHRGLAVGAFFVNVGNIGLAACPLPVLAAQLVNKLHKFVVFPLAGGKVSRKHPQQQQ